jgi:catechol 2,3-dioxygenase-like lactoylglutathione lyase family enzyme
MTLDIRGLAPLLQVFDMPTSIHFYRDILGFEVVNTSGPGEGVGWALLRLNGVELMLNTAYESEQRPPVPDANRVSDVTEPVIRTYGMKQLNVTDPDGYHLCFQCPA